MRWLAALSVACILAGAGTVAAADAPTRDVAIPGKAFEPAHITVLAGTTVTWRNGDSLNHTVTAESDAFDSGYLAPGGSFSYAFTKQGHYAYHCLIHKFMKGTVDVFSLVLTGPESPVVAGKQIVVAGLAPAGTASVTLAKIGGGEPARTVHARPDGSFTVRFRAASPGAYRATVGKAASPVIRVAVIPRLSISHTSTTVTVTADPARPTRARCAPGLRPRSLRLADDRTRAALGALAGSARDPDTAPRAGSGRRPGHRGLGRRRLAGDRARSLRPTAVPPIDI